MESVDRPANPWGSPSTQASRDWAKRGHADAPALTSVYQARPTLPVSPQAAPRFSRTLRRSAGTLTLAVIALGSAGSAFALQDTLFPANPGDVSTRSVWLNPGQTPEPAPETVPPSSAPTSTVPESTTSTAPTTSVPTTEVSSIDDLSTTGTPISVPNTTGGSGTTSTTSPDSDDDDDDDSGSTGSSATTIPPAGANTTPATSNTSTTTTIDDRDDRDDRGSGNSGSGSGNSGSGNDDRNDDRDDDRDDD